MKHCIFKRCARDAKKLFFLLSVFLLYAFPGIFAFAQGTTWEHVYLNPQENIEFSGVASNNTRFVAIAYGLRNYTSSDGLKWKSEGVVPTSFFAITYGNNKFVAVGFKGSIITSSDGINWTSKKSGVTSNFRGVVYAADKNWFVGIAVEGQIAISKDGGNTFTKSVDPSLLANDITYGNGRFVLAGGNGTVYYSDDAVNWTSKKIGIKHFMCGAYGNGTYVVAGKNDIYSSVDGENWFKRATISSAYFHGATYTNFASGNMFVVVGELLSGTNVPLYTSSNGESWTSRISNAGSHLVTVASKGNSQRIVAMGVWSTIVQSDNITPTITVTNPKFLSGKDQMILQSGSTVDITWSFTGSVGNIKLEYSTTGGAGNYTTIADSVPAANVKYNWTVPNTNSTNCIIRVSETDGEPLTHSAPFTISNGTGSQETLTVVSPNGGETLIIGTKHTIKWNSTGSVGDVKLWYIVNGDYTKIVNATANDGSYEWTVPNNPSTKCKIRISETSDGSPYDESDGLFSIANNDDSSLTITAPQSNEFLTVGTKYTIKWESTGSVGDVKLWYAVNGEYSKIVNATANDGSYMWTVPNKPSNQCKIRISESSDGYPYDESGHFSIGSPPTSWITVTSPNGGEVWAKNSTKNITWTTSGEVGNVKILYSTDNGFKNWTTIVSSTANDGSYAWTLPDIIANECLVKISEVSNSQVSDISNDVFTIGGPPQIVLNKTRFNFGYIKNGASPCVQTLYIYNGGGGTLNWTVEADASWINLHPSHGFGGGPVTIAINTLGLSTGFYEGTIMVSDPDVANSPQTAVIYLTVKNGYQDEKLFGVFATPEDGTIGVTGSIAVTGWALDDTCVESVKIYRGVNGGLAFIGDAVFVEGARPDVEQAFPDYPNNSRAGWGYMMLTNFLPNQGNGTFTIYAKATDNQGNEVTLGNKTITCDNANAVKPFGAIDTPAQGGEAFGTKYRNSGWALTPQPNKVPVDGSTIRVFIDGVLVDNTNYNLYRSDIANFFPGYANANGAWAYLDFDTTAYANGVHTIAWSVTDNAGNTDGVGSRYFSIQNFGGASSSSVQGTPGITTAPEHKWQARYTPGKHIPLDDFVDPIAVKRGYNEKEESQVILPNGDGVNTLEAKELERIEIRLGGPIYTGHMVVGDKVQVLPIGSSLDSQRGIFYWQLSPAFLGSYDLEFIVRKWTGELLRKKVRVTVTPKFANQ
jgi:hypothetical protein